MENIIEFNKFKQTHEKQALLDALKLVMITCFNHGCIERESFQQKILSDTCVELLNITAKYTFDKVTDNEINYAIEVINENLIFNETLSVIDAYNEACEEINISYMPHRYEKYGVRVF